MHNQIYEPLQNLSLKKSNELVSAKYKSTLLENQVMAIALTRIEINSRNEKEMLSAKLYPGELKRLIGDPAHIYRTLKTVAKTMVGHTMFLEDTKGNFKAHAIVTDATYEDGVFTVNFNESLREHILGLERNYTTLELSVLTDIKHNSSFRIYELLKKEFYKSNPKINEGRVDVEYQLSEFRFMIGLANVDDPLVKNELGRAGNTIDWDKIYEKLDKKDRKYEKWYELVRNVIVPAQEELALKSNIRFEFEGLRKGKSIGKILFMVYPNNGSDNARMRERQKIIDENKAKQKFSSETDELYRQLELPRDIYPEFYEKYVGHNELTKEDLDLLIKKANNNLQTVKSAIELADTQEYISNYMGWLIKCIENKYYVQDVIRGSAEDAIRVREIKEDYESSKEEIHIKMWQKVKDREEFPEFAAEVNKQGYSVEQMELIYSPHELATIFFDWKLGKKNIADII